MMRSKVEKENHAKSLHIEEVRAAMDHVANESTTLEKQRLDVVSMAKVASVTLSDYDNSRKKVVVEKAELLHSSEELIIFPVLLLSENWMILTAINHQ